MELLSIILSTVLAVVVLSILWAVLFGRFPEDKSVLNGKRDTGPAKARRKMKHPK